MTMMLRSFVVAVLCVHAGCTALWFLNSGIDDLPCGTGEGGAPRCESGFFCEESTNLCKKGGVVAKDEACLVSDECADNRVCLDALTSVCQTNPDDINCRLYERVQTSTAFGLLCRDSCDPAQASPGCGENERCFAVDGVTGVNGVCHPGTCNASSACGTDQCLDVQGEGFTGLCFEACDPLTCLSGAPCLGCEGQDAVPDANRTCGIPVGFPISAVPVCFSAGTKARDEDCFGDAFECRPGTTCVQQNDGSAVCRQFCGDEGDCPQDPPHACTLGTPSLGICEPI
jgi:hypothetical protein